MKIIDRALIIHYGMYTGVHFYAAEYFIFLKENNYPFTLVFKNCQEKDKRTIFSSWEDKYKKEYVDILKEETIFMDEKIIVNNALIIDFTTFKNLDGIIRKNNYYHYTDEILSKELPFKEFLKKNSLKENRWNEFGDKCSSIIDNHYPLLLNFKMFKEIEDFQDIEYLEDKNTPDGSFKIRTTKSNFHNTFNRLRFVKTSYDRSNRLIPECKYYGKEVQFEVGNYSDVDYYDSTNDRAENEWSDYCINQHGTEFIEFLKQNEVSRL